MAADARVQRSATPKSDKRVCSKGRVDRTVSDSVPEAESKFAMSPPLLTVSSAIRPSDEDDVTSITAIYAHHVLHGLASFEIVPPSESDMRQRRLEIIGQGFPYLVADHAGDVVGYAYASPYRLRPAYRYTVENSVYLHAAWVVA